MRKKCFELDRLNIILCLIVVFIHSFGRICAQVNPQSTYYIICNSILRCCAFVVQGFFFLSALKFSMAYKENPLNYPKFLWGRFKKVFVPYIIAVIVYYAYFCSKNYFDAFTAKELVLFILNGTISAPFYFVIALAQFYILMPLWLHLTKKVNHFAFLGASVAIFMVWTIYIAPYIDFNDKIFITYLPYWVLGMIWGHHYGEVLKKPIWKKTFIPIFALVFLILCIPEGPLYLYELSRGNTGAVFHIIHFCFCISAVMLVFTLCNSLKGFKLNIAEKAVNKNSYLIYLWHCLLITHIDNTVYFTSLKQMLTVRVGLVFALILAFCLVKYFAEYVFSSIRHKP